MREHIYWEFVLVPLCFVSFCSFYLCNQKKNLLRICAYYYHNKKKRIWATKTILYIFYVDNFILQNNNFFLSFSFLFDKKNQIIYPNLLKCS